MKTQYKSVRVAEEVWRRLLVLQRPRESQGEVIARCLALAEHYQSVMSPDSDKKGGKKESTTVS